MRTAVEILAAYRLAMVDQDADALADLYAVDGMHLIPFAFPGLPRRFEGREALRRGYRTLWARSPAKPAIVDEVAVHYDPASSTVIAEQSVVGTLATTGERFAVRGVLVLVIDNGEIVTARDYLDAGSLPHARAATAIPRT